jgi:hypothetical protein
MQYRKTAIALAAALVVALSAGSPVAAAHWHAGGGWHGGGGWHRGGWGWGGAAAGFAAGALIGSAVATAPYYYGGYGYGYGPSVYDDYDDYDAPYATAPLYGGGSDQYCAQRYQSYDPSTGTFLGYDGVRHPCP